MVGQDVRPAMAFVRRHGFARLVCVGASLGCTACAEAAREDGVVGFGTISSPQRGTGISVTSASFQDTIYPKLFIACVKEETAVKASQAMCAAAPEPKELLIYPGCGAHGLGILRSEYGENLNQRLFDFVERLK